MSYAAPEDILWILDTDEDSDDTVEDTDNDKPVSRSIAQCSSLSEGTMPDLFKANSRCDDCGKEFKNHTFLEMHKERTGCSKSSSTSAAPVVSSNICNGCNRTVIDLLAHMKHCDPFRDGIVDVDSMPARKKARMREPKYNKTRAAAGIRPDLFKVNARCDDCGKEFKNSTFLEMHQDRTGCSKPATKFGAPVVSSNICNGCNRTVIDLLAHMKHCDPFRDGIVDVDSTPARKKARMHEPKYNKTTSYDIAEEIYFAGMRVDQFPKKFGVASKKGRKPLQERKKGNWE